MKLLMAIHCHQPVGNFNHVFEKAFNKAYLPFLETLERHPKILLAMHYSGSLIDWLEANRPEFILRIEKLVKQNQIEILSCGYYEPILVLLPEEDQIGQIKLLNEKINKLWGVEAKGAWLTERVWEPHLTRIFNTVGINYTLVDDAHFEKTGQNSEDLWGYYVTEEAGRSLNIFPGSKFLRYSLPFKLPEETIKYLATFLSTGKEAITFADDGEKFGFWPHTYKWVYEEGWLEKFFSAVEANSDWIETMTFKEYTRLYPPTGRIYLTCASYSEMLDWSEGYFRNFLVRYPEANNMHKKMLEVSKKLQASNFRLQTSTLNEARRHLYMAQNNDSYWHGVFGGLYLSHLRHTVYANLIKAEQLINRIVHPQEEDWLELNVSDFDCDGREELILENSRLKVYIDPDEKANIFELDYKPKSLNLINTLARRKEKYHERIREKIFKKTTVAVEGTASIHDLEKDVPIDWDKFLIYDRYSKSCLKEYFWTDCSFNDFSNQKFIELDSSNAKYGIDSLKKTEDKIIAILRRNFLIDSLPFAMKKNFELKSNSSRVNFRYEITNHSKIFWHGILGVEFNLSLWDEILVIPSQRKDVDNFQIKDSWFGIEMGFTFDKPAEVWHFPIETVYESETSFEKSFQSLDILFSWNLAIQPQSNWRISINLEINS